MALQASGSISFDDIRKEFGLPPQRNLGAYRVSQTVAGLSNLALDNEVNAGIVTAIMPQSGTIRFSDFYNKRLNIVVNCGSGSRITARSRYDDNIGITTIGGFRRRPSSSSGKKVWIHTNETIGSNIPASSAPNHQYCSLITGGWESNTDLRLDIGQNGFVTGAGGNGGVGGSDRCGAGGGGLFGTSAIGVNYQPIIITNRGTIQGGTGGGGGGGAAYKENRRSGRRDSIARAAGGGGGGGMGSPPGSGGPAGERTSGTRERVNRFPSPGSRGALTTQGSGGLGAVVWGDVIGGTGGAGGNNGDPGSASGYTGPLVTGAKSGFQGSRSNSACGALGGSSGISGFSIIITNNGTGVTITSPGTLIGDIAYNTSVS
jgi:hypothetical protein